MDFATIIKDLVGGSSKVVNKPAMQDDPKKRKPDITKARKYLQWSPQVSMMEGIKKTIDYFRNELKRTRHSQRNIHLPDWPYQRKTLVTIMWVDTLLKESTLYLPSSIGTCKLPVSWWTSVHVYREEVKVRRREMSILLWLKEDVGLLFKLCTNLKKWHPCHLYLFIYL